MRVGQRSTATTTATPAGVSACSTPTHCPSSLSQSVHLLDMPCLLDNSDPLKAFPGEWWVGEGGGQGVGAGESADEVEKDLPGRINTSTRQRDAPRNCPKD